MNNFYKFTLFGLVAIMALTFTACSKDSDDSKEVNVKNINGWYRQDGNYIIFKALYIYDGNLGEYFRVEADNEPDWHEWENARQLPDHSDYYYDNDSHGFHTYNIEGNKIILNNNRTYEIKDGKIYSGNDVYRRW